MRITIEWLKKNNACSAGVEYYLTIGEPDAAILLRHAVAEGYFAWANWAMARLLNKRNRVRYAAFAARSVLRLYEAAHPKDNRPRKAIEAAEAWIENPASAAGAAGEAAWAARAVRAACEAASEAASAAGEAAWAARATNAASEAAKVAVAALERAAKGAEGAEAAGAERARAERAAIDYGLVLLDEQEGTV